MKVWKAAWAGLAAMVVVMAGCATAGPVREPGSSQDTGAPSGRVKRISAAMMGEPTSFVARFNSTQISLPGASTLEQLVNGSMLEVNGEGKLQPQLAEAAPTLENGLWTLFPDGRMETSWKIRGGARWHDGHPVTSEDFLFALIVDQDPEIATLKPPWYSYIERAHAPDPQTVTLIWNRSFVDADRSFTSRYVTPLPKHLVEEAYRTDKNRFANLPYWSQEFVGSGPFSVREFIPGTAIILQASDRYAFGRPKIDEIEVRFVLELNTLMTNILAGAVDLTIGRGFAVEQALQVRDQWRDGRIEYKPRSWIAIHPQFINAGTPIVQDLQFRRAIMHGTDRQQLVDGIQGGLATIAHLYLPPTEPEFVEVEDAVVRYDYDPRRAAQLIEGLGYTRGADGIYRGPGGERLAVELRSNGEPVTEKTIIPVADMWTRLGVVTEPYVVPPQRLTDREHVATFPSFRMMRQGNEAFMLNRQHSSAIPLPETRFVGTNYARYANADWDALIDRFLAAIPTTDRIQTLRQIMRHISEQLNLMGVFYDLDFVSLSNRLQNVTVQETRLWNVQEWEMRP